MFNFTKLFESFSKSTSFAMDLQFQCENLRPILILQVIYNFQSKQKAIEQKNAQLS